jgi:hypothetical protein
MPERLSKEKERINEIKCKITVLKTTFIRNWWINMLKENEEKPRGPAKYLRKARNSLRMSLLEYRKDFVPGHGTTSTKYWWHSLPTAILECGMKGVM